MDVLSIELWALSNNQQRRIQAKEERRSETNLGGNAPILFPHSLSSFQNYFHLVILEW
jgi:hypothetical protein